MNFLVPVSTWLPYVDVGVYPSCVYLTVISNLVRVHICYSCVDMYSLCILIDTAPNLKSVLFLLTLLVFNLIISIDYL